MEKWLYKIDEIEKAFDEIYAEEKAKADNDYNDKLIQIEKEIEFEDMSPAEAVETMSYLFENIEDSDIFNSYNISIYFHPLNLSSYLYDEINYDVDCKNFITELDMSYTAKDFLEWNNKFNKIEVYLLINKKGD